MRICSNVVRHSAFSPAGGKYSAEQFATTGTKTNVINATDATAASAHAISRPRLTLLTKTSNFSARDGIN
jgi:hypothetical protein